MKCVGNYNRIVALLAIAAVFSTVAPARVSAQDVPFITNFVYSSQQTGGISQNGQDGKDGEDGKAGEDGTQGGNGGSVINIGDSSSASIRIESTVDGKKVLDIQKTQAISDGSSSVAILHTSTSSQVEVQGDFQSTSNVSSAESALLSLQEVFFSLRLMLVKYVSELF